MGLDHTDGYRVTVGWSEENGEWIARTSGMDAFIPGEVMGMGMSVTLALADMACALAATCDCLGQIIDGLEVKLRSADNVPAQALDAMRHQMGLSAARPPEENAG
jgi:hypothetical protein